MARNNKRRAAQQATRQKQSEHDQKRGTRLIDLISEPQATRHFCLSNQIYPEKASFQNNSNHSLWISCVKLM